MPYLNAFNQLRYDDPDNPHYRVLGATSHDYIDPSAGPMLFKRNYSSDYAYHYQDWWPVVGASLRFFYAPKTSYEIRVLKEDINLEYVTLSNFSAKTHPPIIFPENYYSLSIYSRSGNAGVSTDPTIMRDMYAYGFLLIVGGLTEIDFYDPPELDPGFYDSRHVDARAALKSVSPTTGFAPFLVANTFSWEIEQRYNGESYATLATPKVTNAMFRWRDSDGSAMPEIIIGASDYAVINPNTFPPGTIDWSVYLETNNGNVNSNWYTLRTSDLLSSAHALSPDGLLIPGDSEIAFEWEHYNETGTLATASDLQKSQDSLNWVSFMHLDGNVLSYQASASDFDGGSLYWRVRTYNSEDEPGAWSNICQVSIIAASLPPSVFVDASPRPTIRWTGGISTAYQLELDGKIYTGRGNITNFRPSYYLSDGTYTARVRLKNSYGLWSKWGSASFTVDNISPGDIIASVEKSGDLILLNWLSDVAFSKVVVFRDGVAIAVLPGSSDNYSDSFAFGDVSYSILGVADDSGNYAISSVLNITADYSGSRICSAKTGKWIDLTLSDDSDGKIGKSLTASPTFYYLVGQKMPSADLSDNIEGSFSINAAVLDYASASQLETLTGDVVCIELRGQKKIYGVLTSCQLTDSLFYKVYNLSIRVIDYSEEVSID